MNTHTQEILDKMNFKHNALTDLITVMDKHNLAFVAEKKYDNGIESVVLKITADYFEDGEPITLREVNIVGDAAIMDIADVAGNKEG